jgi:hypothetical protein
MLRTLRVGGIVASFVLSATLATVGTGCAQGGAMADSSEGAVDTQKPDFAKNSQLAGTIDYGQKSQTVAYAKTPLYRTLRFQGGPGDQVVATVQGPLGTTPLLWLLDAAMQPISGVSAIAPRAGATSTTLSLVLPASGSTFFLAMSTAEQAPVALSVTLAGVLPAAGCDEDNPLQREVTEADRAMPHPVLSFIRASGWNCMHRQWHDVRQLSFLVGVENLYIAKYHPDWTIVRPQEGEAGNGIAFLAMHRVMLGMLRERFAEQLREPAYGPLGGFPWGKVPKELDDPSAPVPGLNRRAFDDRYLKTVATFETSMASFSSDGSLVASDDAFGLYIQTKHRPIPGTDWNLSRDLSTGLHNYLHGRFNDPQSVVRTGNFARNLESQYFWQLHGWLDEAWTRFRKSHGLADATDVAYLQAMNVACMDMLHSHPGSHDGHTKAKWDVGAATCIRMQ